MTSILGLWQMNANDSEGSLRLFLDNQGNLQGKITFQDAPRIDDVTNVAWNDAAGEISFVRNLDQSGVTQTYTGFLGDGHADQFLYLAGSFTESDIPPDAPRTQFGWFARQAQPPPQPSVTIFPDQDITVQPGTFHVTQTYTIQTLNLQPNNQQITWSGTPVDFVTITIPAQDPSTAIFNFNMQGETRDGGERDFDVTVQVVDKLGAFASGTITQIVQEFSKGPPN